MNVKNHIGLLISVVLTVLLLGAGVAMLVVFYGRYAAADQELGGQLQQYNALVGRNPFPSAENVEFSKKNYAAVQQYAQDLRTALRKGQLEPEQFERADFSPLVERMLRQLWSAAAKSKVTFPDGFAFGFKRYIEGDLPARQHIPRLVVQLKTVNQLCRMLFDSKITTLTDLTRQEFDTEKVVEEEVAGTRGRRGRSRSRRREVVVKKDDPNAQKGNALYTIETFKITFSARENAVWTLLNQLAISKLFVIVKSLRFVGEVERVVPISYAKAYEDKIRALAGDRLTANQLTHIKRIRDENVYESPTKEERVVAGREMVDVVMICDVYRFSSGEEAEDVKR